MTSGNCNYTANATQISTTNPNDQICVNESIAQIMKKIKSECKEER